MPSSAADAPGTPKAPWRSFGRGWSRRRRQHAPWTVTIPPAFDALISRCLEPDPARRYQTSGELEADLNRLDDAGELIPVKRVVGLKMLAAVITVAVGVVGGVAWYARTLIPEAAHDPVSVVITDFRNQTGEPAFDRTLEPTIQRALEDAKFITAYDRRAISRTLGVRPPDAFDDEAGRTLASNQALGIVLSGSIARRGSEYEVSMKASQAVTGNVILDTTARASTKDDVVGATTRLVSAVRKALGDRAEDSDQMFARITASTKSLDVLRYYAAAQDAMSNSRFDEAQQKALAAIELDPNFGIGYQVAAVASRNMGRFEESREVHRPGARTPRRDDRAGAAHDTRHVVPSQRRLSEVRRGIRRADRPLCRRRRRAESGGVVFIATARFETRQG